MSDGDFWYATATRMLAPLLFAAAFGGRDMDDVDPLGGDGEEAEVLDLLDEAGVPEAVDAARSTFGKEERQRSSIYTTVETVLEPFAGAATGPADGSERPFDPARLLDGLQHPLPVRPGPRPAPADAAVRRGGAPDCSSTSTTGWPDPRGPLDPPLLLVLDEAANIAPLPDLDALAATAAGHGVQLVTIWHDLAQITARYGPRATTVVNNHRAKLFLSGISDPATLDYASHLIGDEEVLLPATTSGGRCRAEHHPVTVHPRLAPPDALRRTAPGGPSSSTATFPRPAAPPDLVRRPGAPGGGYPAAGGVARER